MYNSRDQYSITINFSSFVGLIVNRFFKRTKKKYSFLVYFIFFKPNVTSFRSFKNRNYDIEKTIVFENVSLNLFK